MARTHYTELIVHVGNTVAHTEYIWTAFSVLRTVSSDGPDSSSEQHVSVDDVKKVKRKEVAVIESTEQRARQK